MEFVIIKIDSPEWNEMWDYVSFHPINKDIENPSIALYENNAWEYRGTYKKGNSLVSEFIHRKHPNTNSLYKINYSHQLITPESIHKSFKI